MSGNNIIRLTLDNSNITGTPKPIGFNIVNTSNPFVSNAVDYEVFLEKCELPIPKDLPLVVSDSPVKITFEATIKLDKDPIFHPDSLFHHMELPREYRTLTELASAINEKLSLLSEPYRWCTLTVDTNDRLVFEVTNHLVAAKTRIWVDGMFLSAFEDMSGVGDEARMIQGHEYFELVNPQPADKPYGQSKNHFVDVCNLKAFRLYSSLPTEAHFLFDQVRGTIVQSNLWAEIIYNTREMIGNTNILYIPSIFKRCSMTDAGEISSFTVLVCAYYANGREVQLRMDRNSYVSITMVFERKEKI